MRVFPRLGAVSAIAGGGLRIVDTFTDEVLSQGTLALLYFVTDVLLLAGVAALWLQRRAALGIAGVAGLAVFVIGILMIRASAFGVAGPGYQLGAAVALLGLALYSIETLVARRADVWAPLAWLVSLAAGVAGTLGFQPLAMTALAGVAFGAGFVAAGAELLRR